MNKNCDRQMEMTFRRWGGRRPDAGRPRKSPGRVAHGARPKLSAHTPAHVTIKLRRGMPNLRAEITFARVRAVLCRAACTGFHIAHWSVQVDHVHLLVEADDQPALSRAMARLNGALARAINRVASRRGSVLRERYHARALRTPREAHHALRYVLNNGHKHGVVASRLAGIDAMSSGAMFDGWADATAHRLALDASVRLPRTWLLRVGWRRHGLIPFGWREVTTRCGASRAPRTGSRGRCVGAR